uniref:Protein krueppel n=1 Tax=Anopheles farauti TaxID=69004 RepID=A0A182QKN8_9DIPT
MANPPEFKVCRYCLSRQEDHLIPFEIVTDAVLTIQDVETITGVQLSEDEHRTCVICEECDDKLNAWFKFRTDCQQNNARYRNLVEKLTTEIGNEDKPPSTGTPASDDESIDEVAFEDEPKQTKQQRTVKRKADRQCELIQQKLCVICGAMVKNLKQHERVHTKETPFECSYCGVRMGNSSNLLRHIDAIHLKRIIRTCQICGKGFTSHYSHRSHVRSQHRIGKMYECNLCNKTFMHHSSLRKHHLHLHTNERKHVCTVCGSRWHTKGALDKHLVSHTSEQPFACRLCPRRYKTPYGRKSHELTHSGVEFPCRFCDKRYRYKMVRNAHERKAHPTEVQSENASST